MLLSNSSDILVAMSARLGTVVGCGTETVSGSYWLTAVREGVLLRFVFIQHARMTRGRAIDDPLASEAEHPIEDFDGQGLLAAIATPGLHARPWLDAGRRWWWTTTVPGSLKTAPSSGSGPPTMSGTSDQRTCGCRRSSPWSPPRARTPPP
jgi:hypothetical protein